MSCFPIVYESLPTNLNIPISWLPCVQLQSGQRALGREFVRDGNKGGAFGCWGRCRVAGYGWCLWQAGKASSSSLGKRPVDRPMLRFAVSALSSRAWAPPWRQVVKAAVLASRAAAAAPEPISSRDECARGKTPKIAGQETLWKHRSANDSLFSIFLCYYVKLLV